MPLTLIGPDLNQLMSLAARLHPYFPSATVVHTDAVIERAASAAAAGDGPVLACLDGFTRLSGAAELGHVVFVAKGRAQAEALREAGLRYVLAEEPERRLVQALRGREPAADRPGCATGAAPARGALAMTVRHRWARRPARRDKHGP